jgi:hypothetical protein
MFSDNSGVSILQRIGTTLQKSDDGGLTFGALGATVATGSTLPRLSDLSAFLTGNSLQFRDNSGTSILARVNGVLSKSDDGGLTFGTLSAAVATGPNLPPLGILTFPPGNRAIFSNENGTSILERIAGALQISDNGGTTFGPLGLIPPGAPVFWFDGQNIDGLGNSSLTDGQAIGTWTNGGSTGAGGNLVQATGGLRPTFKKVANAVKLNAKSSVLFTATQWMQTANTATFAQPNVVCFVMLPNVGGTVHDGNDASNRNDTLISGGTFQLFATSALYDSTRPATANVYHVVQSLFSGTSSTVRANKVTSVAGTSPGAAVIDGMSLGIAGDALTPLTGEIVELFVYGAGTAPATGLIDAYFDTKYGSSWPQ